MKNKAKKGGWKMQGGSGLPSEGCAGMVGAMVATPCHEGSSGLAKFGKADLSPEESPGRVGAVVAAGLVRCRIDACLFAPSDATEAL